MPEDNSNRSFSEAVAQQLSIEHRELWMPMADAFNRQGPEAVNLYLDAEKARLENNVRDLLDQIKER